MDRYYEVVPVVCRRDRFAPDPAHAIAIRVQLRHLFMKLINKLRRYLWSMKRCRKECEDLHDLLACIQPDVETTANSLENCKRLRIETTPQESWLCRLETELLDTEKLIENCAPGGLFTNMPGDGLPQKIRAQVEALKRFAGELPQMMGEVQEMVRIRHAHEFVSDRIGYELRPYSFRCMPWFRNYGNHDADVVFMDGVYFPKAPYDYFVAQPIVFASHASFGRVSLMNPCYVKHIEYECY